MSRAYRVTVNEQLRRHLRVEDGISSRLEVLPILPSARMGELLGAELAGRGFQREGERAVRREEGGVEVAVDLRTGQLEVLARGEQRVELSSERVALTDEETKNKVEKGLRAAAKKDLERQAQGAREALAQALTERLEARLKDLRGELDEVVNRVTASALKERAAQLGTIEEISEDPASGSLTIKVKV